MAKNIYIGNLSFDTTEDTLRASFGAYGEVTSVNIVTDRYSGRPRGFAFVEMENDEAAEAPSTSSDWLHVYAAGECNRPKRWIRSHPTGRRSCQLPPSYGHVAQG